MVKVQLSQINIRIIVMGLIMLSCNKYFNEKTEIKYKYGYSYDCTLPLGVKTVTKAVVTELKKDYDNVKTTIENKYYGNHKLYARIFTDIKYDINENDKKTKQYCNPIIYEFNKKSTSVHMACDYKVYRRGIDAHSLFDWQKHWLPDEENFYKHIDIDKEIMDRVRIQLNLEKEQIDCDVDKPLGVKLN